jgi:hypothetical protein
MDPHQMQLGIVGEHTITRFENLLLGRESGSCCGTPLAGIGLAGGDESGQAASWLALSAVPNTAHAVRLRALARIWRRRLPTVRSSPARKVIETIFNFAMFRNTVRTEGFDRRGPGE